MFKKLKITCDEATTICDKNQYGKASFSDKIKLQIHFLKCKICVLYSRHNTILTKAYKKKAVQEQAKAESLCMSNEEKEQIKREVENLSV